MVRGNMQMNMRGTGQFEHLLVTEVANKRAKVEKLNKELGDLDRKILTLQDEYENKLIQKAKLIDEIEKEEAKKKK